MVVVGVDGGRVPLVFWQRMHSQPVSTFFHLRSELAALCRHGVDAVCFFDAPTGDIAQGGGAVCVERHDGQGHGGVGNVVAV